MDLFIGDYAALIVNKYNELEKDKECKGKFIREVFHDQGRDKDYGGTRTRVNAVLRIIKSNKIIEALEYIVESERLNNDEPKAVRKAREAIGEIKSVGDMR